MQTRGEIRSLTGLRGVAALLVVLFHFSLNDAFFRLDASHDAVLRRIGIVIGHGYLSVDMFFVLSGFVMALSYGAAFAPTSGGRPYVPFLMRRLARIYPLYLLTTLGTTAMFIVHARPPSLGLSLVANLFMVQAWGLADSINGPAWSISTEWAAYLLFPLLAGAALFSRRRTAAAVAALAVASLAMICLLPTHDVFGRVGPLDAHDSASLLPLVRCLGEFCLGLLSFRVARSPLLDDWTDGAALPLVVAIAIVVLLAVPGTDLPVVLLFPLLVIALARGRGALVRRMGGSVLYGLGVVSYSLYLLHFRFIWMEREVRGHLPHAWPYAMRQGFALVAVLALLIACSVATYAIIEKPARQWLRSPRPIRLRLRRLQALPPSA